MATSKALDESAQLYVGSDPIEDDEITGDDGSNFEATEPLSAEPQATESEETSESEETPESGEAAEPEETTEPEVTEGDVAEVTGDPVAEEPSDEVAEGEETDDRRIPKRRFDQVNDRRKAAEKRAAQLEESLKEMEVRISKVEAGTPETQAEVNDLKALRRQRNEAILAGDFDAADGFDEQIDTVVRDSAVNAATQAAGSTVKSSSVEAEIATISNSFVEQYAEFDEGDPAFDENLISAVNRQMRAYWSDVEDGVVSHPEAFKRAVEDVVKLNELQPKGGAAPAPAAAVPPKTDTARKAKAAASQSPVIAGTGAPSNNAGQTAVNIHELSEADMDALPESTLRRLRGDFL